MSGFASKIKQCYYNFFHILSLFGIGYCHLLKRGTLYNSINKKLTITILFRHQSRDRSDSTMISVHYSNRKPNCEDGKSAPTSIFRIVTSTFGIMSVDEKADRKKL